MQYLIVLLTHWRRTMLSRQAAAVRQAVMAMNADQRKQTTDLTLAEIQAAARLPMPHLHGDNDNTPYRPWTPVAAVAARGIKIVVIDSPLNGDSASVFIGPDHRAAGEAAGKLLAGLVGPGDQISVFRLAQENTVTTSREDGAIAALKAANPEQVIYSEIYAGNTPDLQAERARLVFAKHPGVTGILASSTPGTLAMLQLLSSRTPPGAVKLVGFGFNLSEEAATALQNGVLHGWIAQLPLQTGRLGVEHALALLSGKTPPPVVHTEFRVITKDSLSDPAVQALLKL